MSDIDPIELVRASIRLWPKQFAQAATAAKAIKLPVRPARIILVGMGGSAVGARVLLPVIKVTLTIPFEIVSDYAIPLSDPKNTVLIASSYSGTTEEVLTATRTAHQRKIPIIVLTSGGTLATWAKRMHHPLIQFDTQFNPSHQPRLGIGYSLGALTTLLTRWKLIEGFRLQVLGFRPKRTEIDAVAKKLARKTVIIIGAGHLTGVAHLGARYLNETAKQFAVAFEIPEVNHHLLEGLQIPKLRGQTAALFLEGTYQNKKHARRMELTRQLFLRKGIAICTLKIRARDEWTEMWCASEMVAELSATLAERYGVDPTRIPDVETFKRLLK